MYITETADVFNITSGKTLSLRNGKERDWCSSQKELPRRVFLRSSQSVSYTKWGEPLRESLPIDSRLGCRRTVPLSYLTTSSASGMAGLRMTPLVQDTIEVIRDGGVVIVISLDIANAFNSVPWKKIREALKRNNYPDYLRRITDSYLSNKSVKYLIEGGRTRVRPMAGIPQGYVLELLLWNIAYNWRVGGQNSGGLHGDMLCRRHPEFGNGEQCGLHQARANM